MISSITKDIIYVGVNDHVVDLFEGQYIVPNGMAYNSYVIMDERIAVMDTVDAHFGEKWLSNVKEALNGREPDYLVVQHMEPDHSANIVNFIAAYPNVKVVGNAKTFAMIADFFDITIPEENKVTVANGESLSLGAHQLTFVFAPMVHWPEVMVTYDAKDKVLFAGIQDKEQPDAPVDLVIPTTDLELANVIFERLFGSLEKLQEERSPKKESRSERSSDDIASSSPTSRKNSKNDRPSIGEQLQSFREKLSGVEPRVPTREKTHSEITK